MVNDFSRASVMAACGLVLAATTGCSRWIELMTPASTPGAPVQLIAQQEQVPLILDRITVTRNGANQPVSLDTERGVLASIRDIGLFARLGAPGSADLSANEKVIRAHVFVDEALDPHPGAAALKGFAIGASMFLLAPVVSLEYDYAAHVALELVRWDGQVKRYESQSAGTARYHLFGATPVLIDELKGHVTDACWTALMRQVVQDTPFYLASSAPLSDSPIRSVSVKGRRPDVSVTSIVPISATANK
ncbi:MAG TPA: hypothetical protein VFS39_09070 [Nitrospira sp.]|nr:hypothetical protein [Nitrospira sp.]